MAHVWHEDEQQRWVMAPLDVDLVGLSWRGLIDAGSWPPTKSSLLGAVLRRHHAGGAQAWALLTPPDAMVRLNGVLVALGIASLRDRDSILVPDSRGAGRRFYFSTETLAQIAAFSGPSAVSCPRCKQSIEPAVPAVQCPLCGVWHHQYEGKECWTYAPHCAACQKQRTSPDIGYGWTPMEL